MTLPQHLEINASVIVSDLGDEIVLLDTAKEHYYSLNGVGRRFWQLVTKNPGVDAAVATLLSEFDTSEAQLRTISTRLRRWYPLHRRHTVRPKFH